jgi:hypothetical protein
MPILLPNLPTVSSDFGYTWQCWIKTQVDRLCYPVPWIWFSTTFGAWANVDSSNPSWLYLEHSRTVYEKDVGSRLVRDLRAQMLRNIASCRLSPADLNDLTIDITLAAVTDFRSEVWHIDLKKISSNRGISLHTLMADWKSNAAIEVAKNPHQTLQPDEYLIKDLQQSGPVIEYEVIIAR